MRIVIIGASGTIGSAIIAELQPDHELLPVTYETGELRVDLADPNTIKALFAQIGEVDAVVSAAGVATFNPLTDLSDADFQLALENKLMGQVNLVRYGRQNLRAGGTFVLTSGMLGHEPMPGSAAISMVNAGLEGFGRAADLELGEQARVRIVSPVFVEETMKRMGMDSSKGMPAAKLAKIYRAALDSSRSEVVLDARAFPELSGTRLG